MPQPTSLPSQTEMALAPYILWIRIGYDVQEAYIRTFFPWMLPPKKNARPNAYELARIPEHRWK